MAIDKKDKAAKRLAECVAYMKGPLGLDVSDVVDILQDQVDHELGIVSMVGR